MSPLPGSADPIARGIAPSLSRMVMVGGMWSLGGRALRVGVTLVTVAILARLLTPADFGVLAMTQVVTVLAIVLAEGYIDVPVIRHDELSRDGLASLLWSGLAVAAILAAGLWAIAPGLERWTGFDRLAIGLRAAVPVVFAQIFVVAATALLRRQHRFATVAAMNVATVLLYGIPAVLLALAGFGLWSILGAQIGAAVATAILLVLIARLPVLPPRRLALAGMGGSAGYGALGRLLAWGWTSIDKMAVAAVLGPAATGLYSRAYNITAQVKEPFLVVDTTLRQAFASLKHRPDDFDREVLRLLVLIGLVAALIAGALAGLSFDLVALLLGGRFLASAPILAVLLIGFPFRIAVQLLDAATISIGSVRHVVSRNAVMLTLVAGGVLAFAERGAGWVAGTVSAAIWAGGLIAILLYARDRGHAPWRYVGAMLPGLIAGAAMYGLTLALIGAIDRDLILLRLAAGGALLGLVLAALAFLIPERWLPGAALRGRRKLLARLSKRPAKAVHDPEE